MQKIELVKITENSWNPNFMGAKEFSQLVRQIKRFGMRQPVLVRPYKVQAEKLNEFEKKTLKDIPLPDFEIIDGAHRVRASKKAGLTEINCVVIDLSDTKAKAATIAMNQLRGKMDDVSLAKLIEGLKEKVNNEELADLTGIESKQIDILLKFIELPEDFSKLVETKELKDVTFTFVLTEKQSKTVESALSLVDKNNKTFSLLHVCNHFLKSKRSSK